MRTRQRLIEVLDSVNPETVCHSEKFACELMSQHLRHSLGDCSMIEIFMENPCPNDSPHIRELLQEGLAILEADKLTGCNS